MALFLRCLLRFYKRLLSPFLPVACRFTPTCSDYAEECLRLHGVRRGSLLALRRLLRCQPWGGTGYDPVPEAPDCRRRPGQS